MSRATDQARSTRSDARAFADAFAPADDAFTFGDQAGESRTLTLAELGEVIAFDRPVALPDPRRPAAPVAVPAAADADDELLTLDELGDALARPAREADVLDFDFGTQAHERARRRTAARLDASTKAGRRVSGPAPSARQSRRGDVRLVEAGDPATRRVAGMDGASEGRFALADASASVAERLAEPRRSRRSAPTADERLPVGHDLPAALRRPASFLAGPGAHRPLEVVRREPAPAAPKPVPRGVERRPRANVVDRLSANPDRVAMWAVLLGILLVLIAFTSGSAAVALPLLSAL